MQVEHVTGISLTTRRAAQDQRHLTVGHSLFREVVIDHEGRLAPVAEILADGGTGKRCVVLHGGRIGSRGTHDNRVGQRAVLLQVSHQSGHRRSLLADGNIDTIYRFSCIIETLLVDDGVHGNGRLTGLAVADDQLTLSASDGNHRIDSLQARLERFLHGLTVDHTRCLTVERHLEGTCQVDIALAVDGLSEWIDHASEHVVVHADGSDALGALHHLTFLDARRRTEEHAAHIVLLQVHHDSHGAVLELKQLVGLGIAQAIDTSHAVAHGEHGSHFVEVLTVTQAVELLEQHL